MASDLPFCRGTMTTQVMWTHVPAGVFAEIPRMRPHCHGI